MPFAVYASMKRRSESDGPEFVEKMESVEGETCTGCGDVILDRFLLKVGLSSQSWHAQCLQCLTCGYELHNHQTCYFKADNIYCRVCYNKQFATRCASCERAIDSSDWVRRAKNHVYHLACFACDNCKRQLSTGEEFVMLDRKILCKSHHEELLQLANSEQKMTIEQKSGAESDSSLSETGSLDKPSTPRKSKRVRTTFTEEQLEILQANFNVDINPDGNDLERIAQITGLSKRVTQVWFQNSRARQKKTIGGMLLADDKNLTTHMSSQSLKKYESALPSACEKCGIIFCLCPRQALLQSGHPGGHL